MAVPVRAFEKKPTTGELGDGRAMHLHKSCGYAACLEHGITSLGNEDLCCDHFVLRSYEFLEQVDAERAKHVAEHFYTAALTNAVNGCLQGALEVSLRSEALNNLQKARLLDIMLWAGEFVHRADSMRLGSAASATAGVGIKTPQTRSAYTAPQIKTRTSLLPQ